MEPLSLATLAGLTPPDVEIRFFDERLEDVDFDAAGVRALIHRPSFLWAALRDSTGSPGKVAGEGAGGSSRPSGRTKTGRPACRVSSGAAPTMHVHRRRRGGARPSPLRPTRPGQENGELLSPVASRDVPSEPSAVHVLPDVNIWSRFHSQFAPGSVATGHMAWRTRPSPDDSPIVLPHSTRQPLTHLLPFASSQNAIVPAHLISCVRTHARSLPGLPAPKAASDASLPVRPGSLRYF